jgi:ABC-2 type transport system ATP-binding protein
MSEVQQTCHRVGIIRDGALVTVADIDELRAHAQRKITITFADAVAAAEFSGLPQLHDVTVSDTAGGGSLLHATLSGSPNGLLHAAARHDVTDLLAEEPELEELFFTFYDRRPAT